MSAHWFKPALALPVPRGGAPIGLLQELSALELGSIPLLRQWCAGETGRIRIAEDFASVFDPARTAEAVNLLGHLVTLPAQHGRRPLMRQDLGCGCFGGDENVFAQMIAAATAGDMEDAMAFALTLLPPALAYEGVQCAEPLGRAILSLARALQNASQPQPTCH